MKQNKTQNVRGNLTNITKRKYPPKQTKQTKQNKEKSEKQDIDILSSSMKKYI